MCKKLPKNCQKIALQSGWNEFKQKKANYLHQQTKAFDLHCPVFCRVFPNLQSQIGIEPCSEKLTAHCFKKEADGEECKCKNVSFIMVFHCRCHAK